jgi:hypothetical protein
MMETNRNSQSSLRKWMSMGAKKLKGQFANLSSDNYKKKEL